MWLGQISKQKTKKEIMIYACYQFTLIVLLSTPSKMHKGSIIILKVFCHLEENQKPKKQCTHIHIASHGSKCHVYKGPGQADILSSVEGAFFTLHP